MYNITNEGDRERQDFKSSFKLLSVFYNASYFWQSLSNNPSFPSLQHCLVWTKLKLNKKLHKDSASLAVSWRDSFGSWGMGGALYILVHLPSHVWFWHDPDVSHTKEWGDRLPVRAFVQHNSVWLKKKPP